jgi:hypothetical protein
MNECSSWLATPADAYHLWQQPIEATSFVTGMCVPPHCASRSQLGTGNDGFSHPVKTLSLAWDAESEIVDA